MPPYLPDIISTIAAILTTLCGLPQVIRTFRTRETRAISLATQIALACGVTFWLVFGFLIDSWPVIIANALTLVLTSAMIVLKIAHG
jgi:MtN3 and saliva related transmembrane protein